MTSDEFYDSRFIQNIFSRLRRYLEIKRNLDVIYLLYYENGRGKYCHDSDIDSKCVVNIALNKLVITIYNMSGALIYRSVNNGIWYNCIEKT